MIVARAMKYMNKKGKNKKKKEVFENNQLMRHNNVFYFLFYLFCLLLSFLPGLVTIFAIVVSISPI